MSTWNSISDPFGLNRLREWRDADPAARVALLIERRALLTQAFAATATIADGALRGVAEQALSVARDALERIA